MSYKDDFENRSTLLNTYGNNALLLYALELRFEIADIFSVAGDALTDGGEDKKPPKKQYRCTKRGNKKSFCAAYEG